MNEPSSKSLAHSPKVGLYSTLLILGTAGLFVLVWKWGLGLTPYVLVLAALAQAVFPVLKEWKEYTNSKLRIAVLVVIVIVAGLTFISLHNDGVEKQQASQHATKLEAEVVAANTAQSNNTALFLTSFDKLSGQVRDLQVAAKTEELQKKLASVQTELQANEKVMAPGPKAALAFTFWPFTNPPPGQQVILNQFTTLPVNADGNVHVEFSIVNLTDVDAVDGAVTLEICEVCRYAAEPADFSKLAGQPENHRFMPLPRLLARSTLHTLSAEISVPSETRSFVMGISYRCHTCTLADNDVSQGTVAIRRLTVPK